jgi:arylsulfatase A-like enzyme/tetratricopeptide (TPR) repeat protein
MKKLGLAALAALAAGWLLAAAPTPDPSPAERERGTAPGRKPDVLLITIDTLRADATGFSGNAKVSTPVLDRLAAQGRVFTEAHAHNVVTLPSHANILTGLYPYQHGLRDNTGFRLAEKFATLATVLHGAGYATGAFVGAFPLDSRFGLDRGFDVYDDRTTRGDQAETFSLAERRGDEVIAPALEWWNRQRGKPRFLWVHLYDPHAPYAPPEPFASRFAATPYLGEVAATDAFLAPLLGPLLDRKEPPCLVLVTADHGESLGEHGEATHGLFAYEATLKIPLVVWGPGVSPGRDARAARHVDIFPTVLAAAGVKPPASTPARPGRPLLAPVPPPEDSYFEALSTTLNRGWAPLRGLLRGGRKFIALPLPEVYELKSDPREERNRIDADRPLARAAFGALPQESVWPPARVAESAEDAAHLRSLGYLGSSAPARTSYGPEDDPKRLVGLDKKIQQIIDRYSRGQVEEAVRLAREAVAERPGMPLGHSLLAQGLLESGRTTEALDVMRKARAQGTASDALLRQLGLTLAENGKEAEAIDVLRPVAATEDTDAMNALALAYSEAGRQKDAWDLLQKVLQLDPDNARACEQLGLVELRLSHWPQARDWSRRAVDRQRQLPRAWNNLGVALWQLGDKEKAVDAWQQAVDYDPRLWDALWNLGLKAAEIGRTAQARRALERFAAGAPARYGGDVARAREMLGRLPS